MTDPHGTELKQRERGAMTCPHLAGFDPASKEHVVDPYPWLARARRECPVFYVPEHDMYAVATQETIRRVLREPNTYSNIGFHRLSAQKPAEIVSEVGPDYVFPRGLFLDRQDPPRHDQVRKLVQHVFTPRSLSRYEDDIRDIAHGLIASFVDKGEVELVDTFAEPLVLTVILRLLGFSADDAAERAPVVHEWANSFFKLTATRELPHDDAVRHWRNLISLDRWVNELLAERRANLGDDLASDLIRVADAADDEGLTNEELIANTFAFLVAGGAPAMLLTQSLYLLLTHPQQWDAVRADPALIPEALEETMRYRGPVLGTLRETQVSTELEGVAIPAGARVYLSNASAGRDEAVFEQADEFDIFRENSREHMGFGKWTHFCLGAPLTRLEVRIAMELLIERLPGLRLSPDQKGLDYNANIVAPSPLALKLEWDLSASGAAEQ